MSDGEPTMSALRILADHAGDDLALPALLQLGLSKADAHRFMAFMPSGLARPIVESVGVEVADEASVLVEDDQFVTFSLAKQELYRLALNLGRAHRERGVLPHDLFRKIVEGTAEINALDNICNGGGEPEGSVLSTCFLDARLVDFLVDPSAPQASPEANPRGTHGVLAYLWPKPKAD